MIPLILNVALVIAVILTAFKYSIIKFILVRGSSMEPALYNNDVVFIVRRLTFKEQRMYVYRSPVNGTNVIKRLLKITQAGGVRFLHLEGDNKQNSVDSRYYGPVHELQVVGEVVAKITLYRHYTSRRKCTHAGAEERRTES